MSAGGDGRYGTNAYGDDAPSSNGWYGCANDGGNAAEAMAGMTADHMGNMPTSSNGRHGR